MIAQRAMNTLVIVQKRLAPKSVANDLAER